MAEDKSKEKQPVPAFGAIYRFVGNDEVRNIFYYFMRDIIEAGDNEDKIVTAVIKLKRSCIGSHIFLDLLMDDEDDFISSDAIRALKDDYMRSRKEYIPERKATNK